MGVTNKLFQARFFLRSPIARLWLALRFDDVPTVVPPAMIIVGRIRRQHFGRRGGVFRAHRYERPLRAARSAGSGASTSGGAEGSFVSVRTAPNTKIGRASCRE